MASEVNRKSFGKYEIIEELGWGGFGKVYKAEDRVLGRLVAIKILHPALLVETNFIERFRQEARTTAMLDHQNLVPVYEFSENEGRYYIAMGYMAGGSLKELLHKQGKLEPQAAYEILEQVGSALSYAHGKGVIHRDLKPGNILLDENGKARVSDLGFAKVLSQASSLSMSLSGGLVGTPAYMAPEVWRNKPATAQTDIYSLGCILYEMLTGKVLFEGESPAEVMTRHVLDSPEYTPELPEELQTILDKALKREPEERYPDAKDLLADFKAALREVDKESFAIPHIQHEPDAEPVASETKPKVESEKVIQPEPLSYKKDGHRIKPQDIKSRKFIVFGLIGLAVIIGLVFGGVWLAGNQEKSAMSVVPAVTEPTVTSPITEEIIATATKKAIATETSVPTLAVTATSPAQPTVTQIPTRSSRVGSTVINASNLDQIDILAVYDGLSPSEGTNRNPLLYVAWSPDGNRLASVGDNLLTFTIWDLENGEKLLTFSGHEGAVLDLAWSPDGKRLASASNDDTIIIWNVESGEQIRVLEGTNADVYSISWSPDGKWLASGGGNWNVIIWDMDSGEKLLTFRGHTNDVRSVAWSPDGKKVASGCLDGTIILWEVDRNMLLRSMEGQADGVTTLVWSPDGKRLASGSWDSTIILWDPDSGEKLQTQEGVSSFAWSPDGEMLLSGGGRNKGIIIWDAESGEILETLLEKNNTSHVAWLPDGKGLASLTYFPQIILWGIP